jgi:hypothetical protein
MVWDASLIDFFLFQKPNKITLFFLIQRDKMKARTTAKGEGLVQLASFCSILFFQLVKSLLDLDQSKLIV